MQLDYTTINKNLLTIHKLLNDSVENAGFVIKSGCLFSRILMSGKNNDSERSYPMIVILRCYKKNCTILVFLLEIMHLFFHQSTTPLLEIIKMDIFDKVNELEITEKTKLNILRKSDFIDEVHYDEEGYPKPSWIDISITELCNGMCFLSKI